MGGSRVRPHPPELAVFDTLPANTVSYLDPNQIPGLLHCYRVSLYDALQPGLRALSDQRCSATPGPPPAPPTDVAAHPRDELSILVTWVDASTNEVGFEIFRDGTSIGTVGANATRFVARTTGRAGPSSRRPPSARPHWRHRQSGSTWKTGRRAWPRPAPPW